MCSRKVSKFKRRKLDTYFGKQNEELNPVLSIIYRKTARRRTQSINGTCRISTCTSTALSASGSDRSLTGHPSRKRKAPATKQKVQVVPKTVYLLDKVIHEADSDEEDANDHDQEYIIKEEMFLVKGEFDLLTGAEEQGIWEELKEVFRIKYPLISGKDFDFVKRDRNTIMTPVVKENHSWDFAHANW